MRSSSILINTVLLCALTTLACFVADDDDGVADSPETSDGESTDDTLESTDEAGDGDGDGDTSGDGDGDTSGDGDGDTSGDGDGDTSGDGDGDTGESCFDAPQKCLDFIECIGVVVPDQLPAVEAMFGEGGSCWCGTTEDEAQTCYETCVTQLETAIENYPTEPLCHGQYCPIEEFQEGEPYGPPTEGQCPDFNGSPQLLLDNPLGVPGSVCSPACSGVANYCADSPQTVAEGTCMLTVGDTNYCLARCYVDPLQFGPTGTQCPCGAICQPFGPPDGEGNPRGICTYEL